jgi:type IV pilus assembly protein PilM
MNFLNKKIFRFSKDAFGLDLSDLSVKIVQLEKNGTEFKMLSLGESEIPPGSVSDGEIILKENVVAAIKKALEKATPKKIKTKKVICSLPESKGFLRIISLPFMDEQEIKEAIKWEIEANIPLPLEQVYYDWQLIGKGLKKEKNKIEILVVAISRKTADQFLEVLDAAGLEPIGMEIESIAQARSLVNKSATDETVLVVDIGDRRTSFSILTDNIPCFTSSMALSAQYLTDAISKTLNISFEEAEKMKIQYGIGSASEKDEIFRSVEPVLESLYLEIKKTVDFYLENLKYSPSVNKIILCGGGSNTKGLSEYISEKLGQKIEVGCPWTNFNLKKQPPNIKSDNAIRYSTAVGLAIKGSSLETYDCNH